MKFLLNFADIRLVLSVKPQCKVFCNPAPLHYMGGASSGGIKSASVSSACLAPGYNFARLKSNFKIRRLFTYNFIETEKLDNQNNHHPIPSQQQPLQSTVVSVSLRCLQVYSKF